MSDPAQVTEVLARFLPSGHRVGYGQGGSLIIPGVSASDMINLWRAAYAALPATGRWPVLTLDRPYSSLAREDADEPKPSLSEVRSFDQIVRSLDPWPSLRGFADDPQRWVSEEDREVYTCGRTDVDLSQPALETIKFPITVGELTRWCYDRVVADTSLSAEVLVQSRPWVGTESWHTPAGQICVLLLPTEKSWLAPAWTAFHGAFDQTRELAAALWQWYRDWSVQIVANWGTVMWLQVGRNPSSGPDALRVAGQIEGLARNMELTQWELAVALSQADAWTLHDRP